MRSLFTPQRLRRAAVCAVVLLMAFASWYSVSTQGITQGRVFLPNGQPAMSAFFDCNPVIVIPDPTRTKSMDAAFTGSNEGCGGKPGLYLLKVETNTVPGGVWRKLVPVVAGQTLTRDYHIP